MKSEEKREIVDTLLGLEDVNTSFFLPPSPNLCRLHEGHQTKLGKVCCCEVLACLSTELDYRIFGLDVEG